MACRVEVLVCREASGGDHTDGTAEGEERGGAKRIGSGEVEAADYAEWLLPPIMHWSFMNSSSFQLGWSVTLLPVIFTGYDTMPPCTFHIWTEKDPSQSVVLLPRTVNWRKLPIVVSMVNASLMIAIISEHMVSANLTQPNSTIVMAVP